MELARNRYELRPKVSVGPVRLGAFREEILQLLGEPDSMRRDEFIKFRDSYHGKNIFINYKDTPAICKTIEIYNDETELLIDGLDLFSISWPEFLAWLRERDPNLREDEDDTVISQVLGLSTGPEPTEPEKTESIYIFGEDYHWPTEEEIDAASEERVSKIPEEPEGLMELPLEDFIDYMMTGIDQSPQVDG